MDVVINISYLPSPILFSSCLQGRNERKRNIFPVQILVIFLSSDISFLTLLLCTPTLLMISNLKLRLISLIRTLENIGCQHHTTWSTTSTSLDPGARESSSPQLHSCTILTLDCCPRTLFLEKLLFLYLFQALCLSVSNLLFDK